MMKRIDQKKLIVATPVIMGMISVLSVMVYFYSANHAPYKYTDIIFVYPILSFSGVIISIITKRDRTTYPTLWACGLMLCISNCLFFVAIVWLLLVMFK